jgi:hypothetical protein
VVKESEAKRRYFLELGGSMALYVLAIAGPLSLAGSMEQGLARTLLLVAPAISVFVVVWVIARQFRRMDEFVRLRSLEGIAVAGAVTAGLALTYGLLETVGFPRLSMFWVWGSMGFVWGTHSCLRSVFAR